MQKVDNLCQKVKKCVPFCVCICETKGSSYFISRFSCLRYFLTMQCCMVTLSLSLSLSHSLTLSPSFLIFMCLKGDCYKQVKTVNRCRVKGSSHSFLSFVLSFFLSVFLFYSLFSIFFALCFACVFVCFSF